MNRGAKRAGYTLLEMTAVMALLAAVLGLGMALILTVMRADHMASRTVRELTRHAELADQFRADVARAIEATVDGSRLSLSYAGGGQVVYRWHDGMLDRTVRVGDTETRRPININPENMSVEFVRPAGERAIVTVRTIEWPPHGSPRIAEISAALGGDAR
jgi:type II secretory pathway pseudopilin PulG